MAYTVERAPGSYFVMVAKEENVSKKKEHQCHILLSRQIGRVGCHLDSVPLARAVGADPEGEVWTDRRVAPGRRMERLVGAHDY